MIIWLNPKLSATSPSKAATIINNLSMNLIDYYVQRSSLDEGVEPQANGGRKIPVLNMRNDI